MKPKQVTKKIKVNSGIKECSNCNPKRYLKFNFSFLNYEGECTNPQDIVKFYERMKYCCSEPYFVLQVKHQGDKKIFFESVPVKHMSWKKKKEIPDEFRNFFPVETNEKFDILRVYPAGTPNGTANPRIIGMIKNTIFYIFFIDWKGELYNH